LNALQKLHLNDYSSLQKLPTSIGQLNAFQKLIWGGGGGGCFNLQKLLTSIGQLNALQKLHLLSEIIIMYIIEKNNMQYFNNFELFYKLYRIDLGLKIKIFSKNNEYSIDLQLCLYIVMYTNNSIVLFKNLI
jgi:hypothetical protein